MPYIGNVLTSFAVETGNINDQAITSPKLSATGGTDGQVLALDSNGDLVWSSDPAGQWVTNGNDIYFDRASTNTNVATAGGIFVANTNTAANNVVALSFTAEPTDVAHPAAKIGAVFTDRTADTEDTDLYFSVVGAGTASEALRIDSSGRLLVGVTSNFESAAGALLQIKPSASNTTPVISLMRNDTTITNNNNLGQLAFYSNDGDTPVKTAHLSGVASQDHTSTARGTALTFSTTETDTTDAPTERMRIDSSGRLLVGTNTANDADGQSNLIIESNSSAANSYGGLMLRRGSTTIGAGSSLGRIFFADQDGNIGARISGLGDGDWATDDYPAHLLLETTSDGAAAPTERVRIRENLFRIGTSSSSTGTDGTSQLQLVDATNNVEFILRGTSPRIIYDITGTNEAELYYDNRSFVIHSGTPASSGPEVMRLDSSGRVLIGTSTNLEGRQVQSATTGGNNYGAYRFNNGAGGCDYWLYKSRGENIGDHGAALQNDVAGTIQFALSDGANYVRCASIQAAVDASPGSADMPGRLEFATTLNNNSTPVERLRITNDGFVRLQTSGAGIQFNGDTATANSLDDYEEGTFADPEIVPQTGSFSSVTYHADTAAKYIKIGQIVHYWGTVRWTAFSIGTGSGTLRITAPLQVAARDNGDDSDNVGATIVPVWTGTSTAIPTTIQAQNNQSRCILRATRHDAVSAVLLASDVGNTGMIAFSITYRTP